MRISDLFRPTVVGVVLVACSARGGRTPALDLAVAPESASRTPLTFTAEARVDGDSSALPRLTVLLRVQNSADSTVRFDSETDNCEPPLELERVGVPGHFHWSHVGWRRQHEPRSPPPFNDVSCIGTGLILTVPAKGHGEVGRQSYAVAVLRGDSIPPGWYRVNVPAILFDEGHRDVLHLWSAPVRLP